MNTKNINLEKIISTIIGEKFVEFTLLGERIFVPINGLNSFVFEESVIKLKGIDGFNYEIHGENKFMESYKDQLLKEGDEKNNIYFCSVKTIEKFKIIYKKTNI